jgi:hypothetical protein
MCRVQGEREADSLMRRTDGTLEVYREKENNVYSSLSLPGMAAPG